MGLRRIDVRTERRKPLVLHLAHYGCVSAVHAGGCLIQIQAGCKIILQCSSVWHLNSMCRFGSLQSGMKIFRQPSDIRFFPNSRDQCKALSQNFGFLSLFLLNHKVLNIKAINFPVCWEAQPGWSLALLLSCLVLSCWFCWSPLACCWLWLEIHHDYCKVWAALCTWL